MLVLTRKQGEKIRIGKDVTITVIRMKGKAIRLGIEAPHHLSVLRGELCDREPLGEVVEPSARPLAAAEKNAPRPEQAVSSDAWPPAQTKPEQPANGSVIGGACSVDARPESRPLRSLVEQRSRVGGSY